MGIGTLLWSEDEHVQQAAVLDTYANALGGLENHRA
jgi:hypothetical protein